MTISAALRVLGAAVLTEVIPKVSEQRGAVLSFAHTEGSAPLSSSITQTLVEVVPSSGLIMSAIHGAIVGNAPTLQSNLTTAFDGYAGKAFDWGIGFLGKVAQALSS